MDTLLLDQKTWDLTLDAGGNIALATDPYSIAQSVASAVRTFLGEVWYDTALGVSYFQSILGFLPPLELLKAQLVAAALTVPEVTAAKVFISALKGRQLTGQIQVTYQLPAYSDLAQAAIIGTNLITFIGSNHGVVTFIGTNGGEVQFYGN